MATQSSFRFSEPALLELLFISNVKYDPQNKNWLDSDIPIHLGVGKPVISKDSENEAFETLTVIVGELSPSGKFSGAASNSSYYVKAKMGTKVKWEAGTSQEYLDKFFTQSVPALLLGYLRPLISVVTTASQWGASNIPFINFTANANKEQKTQLSIDESPLQADVDNLGGEK